MKLLLCQARSGMALRVQIPRTGCYIRIPRTGCQLGCVGDSWERWGGAPGTPEGKRCCSHHVHKRGFLRLHRGEGCLALGMGATDSVRHFLDGALMWSQEAKTRYSCLRLCRGRAS